MLPVKNISTGLSPDSASTTLSASQYLIYHTNVRQVPQFWGFFLQVSEASGRNVQLFTSTRHKQLIFSSGCQNETAATVNFPGSNTVIDKKQLNEIKCVIWYFGEFLSISQSYSTKSGKGKVDCNIFQTPVIYLFFTPPYPAPPPTPLSKLYWPHQSLLGAWRDLQPLAAVIRVKSSAIAPRVCRATRNTSASSDLRRTHTWTPDGPPSPQLETQADRRETSTKPQ